MKNQDSDLSLVKQAQQALDQAIADPTPQEMERFAMMRRNALETIPAESKSNTLGRGFGVRTPWLAVAFTFVLVIGLGVSFWQPTIQTEPSTPNTVLGANIDDLELLTAEVDLELLEHDVEFYQWVVTQVEVEES